MTANTTVDLLLSGNAKGFLEAEQLQQLCTAAGIHSPSFSWSGSGHRRRLCAEPANHAEREIVSRFLNVCRRNSSAVYQMLDLSGMHTKSAAKSAEEILGDAAEDLSEALNLHWGATGRPDNIGADLSLAHAVEAVNAASDSFVEEFARHRAALVRIAAEKRRAVSAAFNRSRRPAPHEVPEHRQAANRSALQPYKKNGPSRRARSAKIQQSSRSPGARKAKPSRQSR